MRIQQALFMKQTLTPEQYEKFRTRLKERVKDHRQRGGQGRGHWKRWPGWGSKEDTEGASD